MQYIYPLRNSCFIRKVRISSVSLLIIFLFAMVGCKEEERPYAPETIDVFVSQWAEGIPDKLMDQADWGSPPTRLAELLKKESEKKTAALPTKPGDPVRIPDYDRLVKDVYQNRDNKLALVGPDGLTDKGKAVLTALDSVEGEGYEPGLFQTAPIKKLISELHERAKASHLDDIALDGAEIQWAKDQLRDKKPSEYQLDDLHSEQLFADFIEQKGERLQGLLDKSQKDAKEVNSLRVQIESQLAKMYAHYAFLERFQYVRSIFIHPREDDFYNDPEMRTSRPDKAKGPYTAGRVWRKAAEVAEATRNDTVLAYQNIASHLTDLLASDAPTVVVESLQPQHPQYKKLMGELSRYNEIVAAGGWKPIENAPNIRFGSSGRAVKQLKERLKAEGYDVSTDNDLFDDELRSAVESYQATHQYDVTGVPTRALWPSINVSAERRRDQIILNLKRWRATNMRPENDPIYVFVNIPDFNLELWDEGKRQMRFAVVVGNNDSEVDEETKEKIWKNRTPVPLAAYIDRVIYNPFWNVTPRIRQDEILPKVKEEIERDYEALKEKYRQALGIVKPPMKGVETSEIPPAPSGGQPSGVQTEKSSQPSPSPGQPPAQLPSNNGVSPGAPQPPKPPGTLTADTSTNVANRGKAEALRLQIENFPYYNKETGEIDVSKTDRNYIPKWYENNNYEVVWMGPNWEYVRMTQGPHNALGKVKVIFPNYYDVYLHDTPAKSKFKSSTRAFSHGCIRMEQPLEFAEYLLKRDGKYEEKNVPKIVASGDYYPIFFDRKIPVFLEYYTVRVDDNGRANFLADPYRYDAEGIVIPTPPPNRHLEP